MIVTTLTTLTLLSWTGFCIVYAKWSSDKHHLVTLARELAEAERLLAIAEDRLSSGGRTRAARQREADEARRVQILARLREGR